MNTAVPPGRAASRFVDGGPLERDQRNTSLMPGVPLRCLFAIFLIFDFPAFTIQLAMDPATGNWVGSPVMQFMTMASELFVFGLILSSHNVRSLVFRSWPIWTLVLVALVSTVWSFNRAATIHTGNTYLTTALFGLTVVGVMPQFQGIRFVIRTMVLGCLLSFLWVFLFPEVAIHQLTDPYQTVHAGLWRGIFSHKQGLGYFSGLTVGLLIFYRTLILPLPVLIPSFAICLACLIGTESATGFVAAVLTPALLYTGYLITRLPVTLRKVMMLKFALGVGAMAIAYKSGLLNFLIVGVLGKSLDLTGRADIWPIVLTRFYSTGLSWFGAGYGADIASALSEYSVDNGYIDKFLEFGFFFSPLVFGIFAALLWASIRLLLKVPTQDAQTTIFAFAIWSITLILNITESNFMTKCISTVLTSMVVGLLVQNEQFVQAVPGILRRRPVD